MQVVITELDNIMNDYDTGKISYEIAVYSYKVIDNILKKVLLSDEYYSLYHDAGRVGYEFRCKLIRGKWLINKKYVGKMVDIR
jgi:hypothetical protein